MPWPPVSVTEPVPDTVKVFEATEATVTVPETVQPPDLVLRAEPTAGAFPVNVPVVAVTIV